VQALKPVVGAYWPAMQLMQTEAPYEAHVPEAQLEQLDWAAVPMYLPTAQRLQDAAFAAE